MSSLVKMLNWTAAVVFLGCGSALAQGRHTAAFVDVAVIPMDTETVLPHQTVIVREDRITMIGPATSTHVPDDAQRIDGRGKFLIPGLVEMHGHVPPPTDPAEDTESLLFLFLANGITTVRGMLGAANQLSLRADANSRSLLSPTLYLAGPGWTGDPVHSPEQAALQVRDEKVSGWDLFKIHAWLTREEFDAVVRTAREIGHPFAGHVPLAVDLLTVLQSGQQTIEHLDGYLRHLDGYHELVPELKLIEVAEQTKQAGVAVVPTIFITDIVMGRLTLDQLKDYPELKYVPPRIAHEWHVNYEKWVNRNPEAADNAAVNQRRIVRTLKQRGVTILLGTDSPQLFNTPGFSMHREVLAMQEADMTPYEILRAGTFHAGQYFRGHDHFGVIAVGYRADLLLLEGNPLQDLGNLARPAGVMVAGRWLPNAEIQRRLERIAAAYEISGGRH